MENKHFCSVCNLIIAPFEREVVSLHGLKFHRICLHSKLHKFMPVMINRLSKMLEYSKDQTFCQIVSEISQVNGNLTPIQFGERLVELFCHSLNTDIHYAQEIQEMVQEHLLFSLEIPAQA